MWPGPGGVPEMGWGGESGRRDELEREEEESRHDGSGPGGLRGGPEGMDCLGRKHSGGPEAAAWPTCSEVYARLD